MICPLKKSQIILLGSSSLNFLIFFFLFRYWIHRYFTRNSCLARMVN